MKVVSDSGPLIWLARCGNFWLLKKLYDTIYIPNAVFLEVVERGAEKGYPDASVVRESMDQGWIKVKASSNRTLNRVRQIEMKLAVQLGEGEREALALGIDRKGMVLTNDHLASTVAKTLGINVRGVLFLLLLGVQKGWINRGGASHAMQVMLQEGFWLSPDHVQRFYEALERVK